MARPKQVVDTYSTDKRDSLELLARMMVGGGYRQPVEGRASLPGLQAVDIAGAVGFMGKWDALGRDTAVAVATQADEQRLARLAAAAYRQVLRTVRTLRPAPLDLDKPEDRWRLRIVIFDAAHDLVYPTRRAPFGQLAKEAKMRKASYMAVHRCASAVFSEALDSGRSGFKRALWGGGL